MHASDSVVSVAIPDEARIRQAYSRTHLADAYEALLPEGASHDPEVLARFMFTSRPPWVSRLMRLRDFMVGWMGLKTAAGLRESTHRRIGLFRVYETHPTEVVMGEDDSHLDFRVSVLLRSGPAATGMASSVVVSTVVHCHNLLGRSYIFVIAPFHRLVVKAGLRRAAASGWPLQAPVPSSPRHAHRAGEP